MTSLDAPLHGRVALVTGGAGRLGAAICQSLAAAGASVVVGYNRSADTATALAAALPSSTGASHCALKVPVTDSAMLPLLASDIARRYGRCDIVVNCAGITRFVPHGELDALDDALFDEIFATNVRGPFAVVRALRGLLDGSDSALV